jgi:hypothetical protein
MDDLNQTISKLRLLFEREFEARRRLAESRDSAVADAEFQERIVAKTSEDIQWARRMIREILERFQQYPLRHSRHFAKLEEFICDGAYEQSIFVVTKFPDGHEKHDQELRKIIDITRQSINECGYVSRLASDKRYHPMLWDNVELYLLGCSKGVALVEDRYKPELNPNVALEWGWMKGMGKDVLFLVEENFHHDRADWSGYLNDKFSWEEPDQGIKTAIQNWLSP